MRFLTHDCEILLVVGKAIERYFLRGYLIDRDYSCGSKKLCNTTCLLLVNAATSPRTQSVTAARDSRITLTQTERLLREAAQAKGKSTKRPIKHPFCPPRRSRFCYFVRPRTTTFLNCISLRTGCCLPAARNVSKKFHVVSPSSLSGSSK